MWSLGLVMLPEVNFRRPIAVVAAWPGPREAIKAGILAMVRATRGDRPLDA
jgi:hypothetical protein